MLSAISFLIMSRKGSNPSITIAQMGWVFEKLDEDVPLKSLAGSLKVDVTTLQRWIDRAEKEGFAAFRGKRILPVLPVDNAEVLVRVKHFATKSIGIYGNGKWYIMGHGGNPDVTEWWPLPKNGTGNT